MPLATSAYMDVGGAQWKVLDRHEEQEAMWRTSQYCKTIYACASRGAGKSEMAKRRLAMALGLRKPWYDPRYFYAAPTYRQVKRVVWQDMLHFVPPAWIAPHGISHSELTIRTVFGSELVLFGLDSPQRMEGVQWDGGVVDECSDVNHQLVDMAVIPALTHRDGWLWKIGVPKRFGIGAYEFKKQFLAAMRERRKAEREGRLPEAASFIWPADGIVPQARLDMARRTMDPLDFDEQFGAQWLEVGGGVYHSFSAAEDGTGNVKSCPYRPDLPIRVGMDFNVNPGAITLGHKVDNHFEVFDEFHLLNTNTQRMLDVLWNRYGTPGHNHRSGFWFYGDATGRARKTAAAASDYTQIFNDPRFREVGRTIHWQKSNPPRADRFACTNALIKNGEEVRRLFIDPHCAFLIDDYMHRAYREHSRDLPPDEGMQGHHADSCLVAETPVVTDQGLYPIVQVPVGAKVLTRRGYSRVIWSGMTSEDEPIYRLTYGGGTLDGTADHPVFADGGFQSLTSLRTYSKLYLARSSELCPHSLDRYSTSYLLNTEESFTDLAVGECNTTFAEQAASEILGICTDRFGSTITGRFLKGMTSTIRMVISTITASRTWSVSPAEIIDGVTSLSKIKTPRLFGVALRDWQTLARLQRNGMDPTQVLSGIARTVATWASCCGGEWFTRTVSAVVGGSRLISPLTASALLSAYHWPVTAAGSTTRRGSVSVVGKSSASTSTSRQRAALGHVVSVQPTGERRPVYNLKVEGQPEFFAGESRQCLVHNCDYIIWRVFPLRLHTQELPEISINIPGGSSMPNPGQAQRVPGYLDPRVNRSLTINPLAGE